MANNENENDAPQVYLLGKTYLANNQGQFYIRNDPIIQMAAGDRHTIIVTESGRAFAFGDNGSGQLGLGHTNPVEKVSCIKSLKFNETGEKVILAACGRESSLVATNHGSLYAFGSNSRSQLAMKTSDATFNEPQPKKIESLKGKKWTQIAMGAEHACALTDEGTVYVWGANDDGQCAQPHEHDTITVPRELRVKFEVTAIACGYYHTALISGDGRLYVFGNNEDRQLGRSISDKYGGPQPVTLPDKVKAVACGNQHTIVLTEKGEVYACGLGDRGQLGLGPRVVSAETFEVISGLPKRVTAIAAGEAHTAVIGSKNDMYVFGDGKHGKLGPTIHSNEFEPCFVDKFKTYSVTKVVCGGCQTILIAQKKTSETRRGSESEEDIGNTLSVTQRQKSLARTTRLKNLNDRTNAVGDSMDSTLKHVRPLGKPNPALRTEADDDKSDKELSASIKSATFNQTHTMTNGRFRPTQSPTLNRASFRSKNNKDDDDDDDDGNKTLKTGVLDRTARLNKDTDDLNKTKTNRFPSNDKSPDYNRRFERTSPLSPRKKRIPDNDDSDKSSSDEKQLRKSFPKKTEQSSPRPLRNERKPSLSPVRRKNDSESDDNTNKRSTSVKTANRKTRPPSDDDDDDKQDDDNDDDDDDRPQRFNRGKQPPTPARRSSLPQATRSGAAVSSSRDGNQTIGSKPVDGVRGSVRGTATKSLAKNTTNTNTDSNKKETTPAEQPGFFARLFGGKSTPPPPPPPPKTETPATNTNSKTCSIM